MRRTTLALCLIVAACGGAASNGTTTTATPATLLPTLVTTTVPSLPVEVSGCSTPQVTFSALCEAYDLLQNWHVDQPLDPEWLAELATAALSADFDGFEKAPMPRTMFCSVPDGAFRNFCHQLASLVAGTGLAVGPVMDHVVASMVEDGLGPFTYYLAPNQNTAFRDNGVVGGIGVLLDATDAVGSKCARLSSVCPLRIVVVLEDNAAAAAGLMAGDVVVEVDGEAVDGQGFAATAARIAGDETGVVSLTIDRDGDVLAFEIERDDLVIPNVEWEVPVPGVAYLRIPDFESDIPDLVRTALEDLSGSWSTMVVDLRDNPGGLVVAAIAVASEFVASGPVLVEHFHDGAETYDSFGSGLAAGGRVIVVVNEGTASAAEILAGALRDRRSAAVVGAPTFGKDAVQIRFDMRNGGRLDVVVARWASPEGHSVANGGIVPDHYLELDARMTPRDIVEAALGAAS